MVVDFGSAQPTVGTRNRSLSGVKGNIKTKISMQHIQFFNYFLFFFLMSCSQNAVQQKTTDPTNHEISQPVERGLIVGAERTSNYLPTLKGKNVGAVVNQTSMIGDKHLIDNLLEKEVNIKTIFSPEHGFRGTADAGEKITDGKDPKTGLPLISLYGKSKKPSAAHLEGLDIVIFDIQDVGARFYTYISTMAYVMEACAENGIKVIVLDRPNPNGHYVDGPILRKEFKSFVGMHEVPVVHGMTIGEYAKMLNGEGWLAAGVKCDLTVIPCENYDHRTMYELPVKPSPNLPMMASIYAYPSLCFFEGTVVSVGRGTEIPFAVYGHPEVIGAETAFTPEPMPGAKYPKLEGKNCKGFFVPTSFEEYSKPYQLNLSYLIDMHKQLKDRKEPFFLKNGFFDKLAGTDILRKQIKKGMSEEAIRATWQTDIQAFKNIRKRYLLYPDFE